MSQSLRFFKSEFVVGKYTTIEEKICVSSVYKQGVVNFKQFGKSFMYINKEKERTKNGALGNSTE